MNSHELIDAAIALNEIVEGVRCERWAAGGRRLKDTLEWAVFYVALNKARKEQVPDLTPIPPNHGGEGKI